ncbi:hypothetical protein AURDEDRAFT_156429 [Auricularia subglabra TFB-10046 SS5]|nr:hypothetical protein AURDEDRAFT_156429 [Auricularia subglabra TFB-10046 SS5]
MSYENQRGQGVSHAKGNSAVPHGVQEKLPKSLEDQAPESIHPTGSDKAHIPFPR